MESEHLTTSDLAAMLGVSSRRAQQIVAALESLGFALEKGRYGERLIPRPLASLVARLREEGRDLEALLSDPQAWTYLRTHPGAALGEALGQVLHAAALVRRALGILDRSSPLPPWGGREAWEAAGLEPPGDWEG